MISMYFCQTPSFLVNPPAVNAEQIGSTRNTLADKYAFPWRCVQVTHRLSAVNNTGAVGEVTQQVGQ